MRLEELEDEEVTEGEEELYESEEHVGKFRMFFRILLFSAVPVILFYLMESFEHNAYEEVRSLAQCYNILLFELIAWILFFITGNGKIALRIETAAAFLYGLVNHYIMVFRSTPLVPWDVFSIKTAASVADSYDFTPTEETLMVCGGFVLVFILLHFVKLKFPYGIFMRVIPTVCVGLILGTFVNLLWDDDFQTDSYLYPYLFTPSYMTQVNGMAVTFAMNLEYMQVEKPDGYSVERAQAILTEYETDGESQANDRYQTNAATKETATGYPNIIVVMNEAFSDLTVLGDFTTNEDYMPFIHSLQEGNENTITGNLTVSVCGGNTANTEFEFLTGHTMDFFPVGSIPYQQYITGETSSLASLLGDLGYETYGMHPYNATGWNRNEVYPFLGFDETYFLSDFTSRRYIRKYVSDETAYNKIIETYNNKEEGTPGFIFEVTMQNHGAYTDEYENFTSDIQVEGVESAPLEQYLSLIKISDQQLQRLIAYFSEVEENTIIVFFGDHQPSDAVVKPILSLNEISLSNMTEEQAQLRYVVPYVIWANFDIEEETNADTDISFLAAKLMEIADIPTTAYQNFLQDFEENQDSKEYQEKYQILQYYFMFEYREEQK